MNDHPPTPATTASRRPVALGHLLLRALAFVLIFMALQAAWEAARGSWIERLWVHDLTVRSATWLINTLTPSVQAAALGARITAPGGGLNVLFGCEGTDVVFMLAAALAVFPLTWRVRALGMVSGLVWVFVLNQARIAALFYAFRANNGWFDLLHNTAAPLLMVALTGLFFHLWLRYAHALAGGSATRLSPAPAAAP
jgi:exosortase family protein XrtM